MSVTRQVQLVTADGRLVQAALTLFSLRRLIVCFLPESQQLVHIDHRFNQDDNRPVSRFLPVDLGTPMV
jgi:hypothetical protein